MNINYNKLMHEQISGFGDKKPRLLLHCCCAPCSSAVIEKLKDVFEITFYYYNPNIFPEEEYNLRQEEFKKLDVNLVAEGYNHQDFINIVKGMEHEKEGGMRCRACIAQRMKQAFIFANNNNFDYATTTLSISPHKDAKFINELGAQLEQEYNVNYLYADFKKENGYLRSIQICKDLNIYRQDYCGCEFSINKNDAK